MKVLVIGGLGFQGLHLIKQLYQEGHQLSVMNTPSTRALDMTTVVKASLPVGHDPIPCVFGSITDRELLTKAIEPQDLVIDLAAWTNPDMTIDKPLWSFYVNGQGTGNVLEICRTLGCKLLLVSSCEVYGSASGFQDERAPMYPTTPYAAGKAAGDVLAQAYIQTYGLKAVVVRPCNVFGQYQRSGKFGGVIPNFVQKVLLDQELEIRGDGMQRRHYIYITDLIEAYMRVIAAFDTAQGQTFNITTGYDYTMNGIANTLSEIVGRPLKSVYTEARQGDVKSFDLDGSKFRRTFSWAPKVTFPTGLRLYYEWAYEMGRV